MPPEMLAALDAVDGLQFERSDAEESEPVMPVEIASVDAVKPYVTRQVLAMIQLQLTTAARPGEIRIMRTCDIEQSGKVWEYRPESHKTEHHGRDRVIFLNGTAQEIVKSFLKSDQPEAFIFSPADAKAEFHAARSAKRVTPMTPSQLRRQRAKNPKRKPSDFYSDNAYGQAIRKACVKAGIESWHPHQLRHTKATEIRERFGLEAAQVVLGQAYAKTTEIYAKRDQKKARKVMQKWAKRST